MKKVWFALIILFGLLSFNKSFSFSFFSRKQAVAMSSNKKQYKCVVFDWDGTVADSVPILMEVVNELAGEFKYAPVNADRLSEFRMMSAMDFLRNELQLALWNLPSFERRSKQECLKKLDKMFVFKGMKEVIDDLQTQGYQVGILSSNSEEVISQVLKKNNVTVSFIYSGASIFGKAQVIKTMLRKQKIKRDEVVYVGDELRDVDACTKAGIPMVAVDWGFNAAQVLQEKGIPVVSTPDQLLQKFV
jgi:phosphoglycolate phosphatase